MPSGVKHARLFHMAYNSLYEWQEIEALELGNKKIDELRKEINNINIQMIKFSLLGETILEWNEAVFVDYDGSTSKIMHLGTKYSQKDGDQPASTVIKGAKIEDVAVPTVNVRYSDLLKDWVTDSMYPSDPGKEPGQLRLMLPIQLKEVINEYIFVFDVKYVFKYPERLNQ